MFYILLQEKMKFKENGEMLFLLVLKKFLKFGIYFRTLDLQSI